MRTLDQEILYGRNSHRLGISPIEGCENQRDWNSGPSSVKLDLIIRVGGDYHHVQGLAIQRDVIPVCGGADLTDVGAIIGLGDVDAFGGQLVNDDIVDEGGSGLAVEGAKADVDGRVIT